MRHYEIVLLVHPDRSDQVSGMVERYKTMVGNHGGTVHRFEDWGRRQLAYSISKVRKAHYILLNIECNKECLEEIQHAFRYNDAIIRYLVLQVDEAMTEPSAMMKSQEHGRDYYDQRRQDYSTVADEDSLLAESDDPV